MNRTLNLWRPALTVAGILFSSAVALAHGASGVTTLTPSANPASLGAGNDLTLSTLTTSTGHPEKVDSGKVSIQLATDGLGHPVPSASSVTWVTLNPGLNPALGLTSLSLDLDTLGFVNGTVGGFRAHYITGGGQHHVNSHFSAAVDVAAQSPVVSTTKIVFESYRTGFHEIFAMNPDGSNLVNLTNYSSGGNAGPAVSPDGTRIAFSRGEDGFEFIYVMDADGSNQVRLTNSAAYDFQPAWSPDGSKIAFTRNNNSSGTNIFVMDADGSNQVNLTNNGGGNQMASWSPDGTKIAFRSGRDGTFELYVMNPDGTNPTRLTNSPSFESDPAWSPDGTKIAYSNYLDGNYEIYVMNADGSNPVNLTNNSVFDEGPTWSPDGTQIAFQSLRDGNYEIYVMNADGTNQVNLTNDAGFDYGPSWGPGGVPAPPPSNASNLCSIELDLDRLSMMNLAKHTRDD